MQNDSLESYNANTFEKICEYITHSGGVYPFNIGIKISTTKILLIGGIEKLGKESDAVRYLL